MKKKESLEEMVERRNRRLLYFFTSNDINVRLVGDPQKPAVIRDEKEVLSCYVKNFDLHFTREPFSEVIVQTVKLKGSPELNRMEIEEVLEHCTHRAVYRIKLSGTDLYLVGYNYLNPEDGVGRYPVFARHKPKVYFDEEYAQKVLKNLQEEQYEIEIV